MRHQEDIYARYRRLQKTLELYENRIEHLEFMKEQQGLAIDALTDMLRREMSKRSGEKLNSQK